MDVTNGLGDKITAALDKLPGIEQPVLDALKQEISDLLAAETTLVTGIMNQEQAVIAQLLAGIARERQEICAYLDSRLPAQVTIPVWGTARDGKIVT